jgi:hypothetical protein
VLAILTNVEKVSKVHFLIYRGLLHQYLILKGPFFLYEIVVKPVREEINFYQKAINKPRLIQISSSLKANMIDKILKSKKTNEITSSAKSSKEIEL